MNSKIKGLMAGVIIVLILTGAVVALKLTEKTDSDSSSSSEITSRLLYEKKLDDVDSVVIKNSKGEYEITRTGNEKWTVKDFEDLPLNETFLTDVATAASKVTSTKVVEENAENLEKYGLTNPQAEVTVTFKDSGKTVKELLLGDTSPTSGQSYFSFKGENTVYLVTTSDFSAFTEDKNWTINRVMLEAPADDNSYPRIDEITITRPDIDYSIKLVYDAEASETTSDSSSGTTEAVTDQVHKMAEPIDANLNDEAATTIVRGMYGLTAARAITVHPTEEQLSAAGITSPAATVLMKSEQDNYKLSVGIKVPDTVNELGGYYGYFDGVDVLFQFNASALPWLTVMPTDITSSTIFSTYIYDISKLEITTPDNSYKYELSGSDTDTFEVTKNGTSLDADCFRDFYKYLLKASGESLWLEEPSSDIPDVKIAMTLKDGGTQTIEFYNTTERQTIIKYNGKPIYKGRTSYIERLMTNISLLDTNGEIIQNW